MQNHNYQKAKQHNMGYFAILCGTNKFCFCRPELQHWTDYELGWLYHNHAKVRNCRCLERYTDIRFYGEIFSFLVQHRIPLEVKGNVYAAEKIRLVCEFEGIWKRNRRQAFNSASLRYSNLKSSKSHGEFYWWKKIIYLRATTQEHVMFSWKTL